MKLTHELLSGQHFDNVIVNDSLTAKTCGINSSYKKLCGLSELTCDEVQADPQCDDDPNFCKQRCFCDDGYRRHHDDCVTVQQCKELEDCSLPFRAAKLPVSISTCFILMHRDNISPATVFSLTYEIKSMSLLNTDHGLEHRHLN